MTLLFSPAARIGGAEAAALTAATSAGVAGAAVLLPHADLKRHRPKTATSLRATTPILSARIANPQVCLFHLQVALIQSCPTATFIAQNAGIMVKKSLPNE